MIVREVVVRPPKEETKVEERVQARAGEVEVRPPKEEFKVEERVQA